MKDLRYISENIYTSDTGESVKYIILLDAKKRIFYYIILDDKNGWHFYQTNILNDLEAVKKRVDKPKFITDEILKVGLTELITKLRESVND